MCDPLAVIGGVGSILQIISSVTKVVKSLNEVRESYNHVALNTTLVASQLATIRAALQALHAWRTSDTTDTEASKQLDNDLGLSLSCCAILITVIDGKLSESGYRPDGGVKQKIKYVWLEDILKEYVSNLEGQVRALQLLLTIFQCRTTTEQKQQLAKAESRDIMEQVRTRTMTMTVAETELDDAISIFSHDPSVRLDVESILMDSPAYRRVYGERPRKARARRSSPPPPVPPRPSRRKPKAKVDPETEPENMSTHMKPLPQPPQERATKPKKEEEPSSRPANQKTPAEMSVVSHMPSVETTAPGGSRGNEPGEKDFMVELKQRLRQNRAQNELMSPQQRQNEPDMDCRRESVDEGSKKEAGPLDQEAAVTVDLTDFPTILDFQDRNKRTNEPATVDPVGDSEQTEASEMEELDAKGHESPNDETESQSCEEQIQGLTSADEMTIVRTIDQTVEAEKTEASESGPEDVSQAMKRQSLEAESRDDDSKSVDTTIQEPNPAEPIESSVQTHPNADEPSSLAQKTPLEDDSLHTDTGRQWVEPSRFFGDPRIAASPQARSTPPVNSHILPPIEVPSSHPIIDPSQRRPEAGPPAISPDQISASSGAVSTISSSEHTIESKATSMAKTSSNTAATSVTIDESNTAQDGGRKEIQRLQSELTAAKARGDSRQVEMSLQAMIDTVRRTYLEGSTTNGAAKSRKPRSRASLIRLPSRIGTLNSSALADAVVAGNLATVTSLLDAKPDANVKTKGSMTLMMLAAMHGHTAILNALKERGADAFAVDENQRSVLHIAVASNRLAAVKWLLDNYFFDQPQRPKHRNSILFKATDSVMNRSPKNLRELPDAKGSKPLHIAVEVDKNDLVKALIDAGVNVESKDDRERTALVRAIMLNRTEIFDTLLDNFAHVNATDEGSMSCLHWAAKIGNLEFTRRLVAKGANKNSFNTAGNYPIHNAAWRGHLAIVDALLDEETSVQNNTKAGESTLHIACLTENTELAQYLLRKGADVNAWATPQSTLLDSLTGWKTPLKSLTPLQYACCKGHYEMALLLLDHSAWINAPTPDGATALMMAVESENTNVVNLLLSRGAKVNAGITTSLVTALHIASRRGDLETVQQLCLSGADTQLRSNIGTGKFGRIPVEEASQKCTDKGKRDAVERYFVALEEYNDSANGQVRYMSDMGKHRFPARDGKPGYTTNLQPVYPVNYPTWEQQYGPPLQQNPYTPQQVVPFSHPPITMPAQTQMTPGWNGSAIQTQTETASSQQTGSFMPVPVVEQVPVHYTTSNVQANAS